MTMIWWKRPGWWIQVWQIVANSIIFSDDVTCCCTSLTIYSFLFLYNSVYTVRLYPYNWLLGLWWISCVKTSGWQCGSASCLQAFAFWLDYLLHLFRSARSWGLTFCHLMEQSAWLVGLDRSRTKTTSSVSQVINFVDIFWFSFYVISVCDEEACPEDNKKCIVNEVGEPKCLCNEGYDKTLTLEEQVSEANQRICVFGSSTFRNNKK